MPDASDQIVDSVRAIPFLRDTSEDHSPNPFILDREGLQPALRVARIPQPMGCSRIGGQHRLRFGRKSS